MKGSRIDDNLKNDILSIIRKYKINKASIFGSYARGEANNQSDIDILIESDNISSLMELARIKRELEDKLNLDVDILTYDGINHIIKKKINKEEIRIL